MIDRPIGVYDLAYDRSVRSDLFLNQRRHWFLKSLFNLTGHKPFKKPLRSIRSTYLSKYE